MQIHHHIRLETGQRIDIDTGLRGLNGDKIEIGILIPRVETTIKIAAIGIGQGHHHKVHVIEQRGQFTRKQTARQDLQRLGAGRLIAMLGAQQHDGGFAG